MGKEIIPETINVHPKHCVGCRFNKRDIMVSVGYGDPKRQGLRSIDDIFLTTHQAATLINDLQKQLERNQEE